MPFAYFFSISLCSYINSTFSLYTIYSVGQANDCKRQIGKYVNRRLSSFFMKCTNNCTKKVRKKKT